MIVWLWDAGSGRGVTDDQTRARQAAEALLRGGRADAAARALARGSRQWVPVLHR